MSKASPYDEAAHLYRVKRAERDAEICRLVKAGASKAHVGREFGLSRERIRQIVGKT